MHGLRSTLPETGILAVDSKGALWKPLAAMARRLGQEDTLRLILVRPTHVPPDQWKPPLRLNLLAMPDVPWTTYAKMIVDTATAAGQRSGQSFFKETARDVITHAMQALEVADRIVVMNKGKVEQVGTSDEVYENPASSFVLNFLGNVNLFHGRQHQNDNDQHDPHKNAVSYVRSHDIDIDRSRQDSSALKAEIKHIQKLGPAVRVTLAIEGNPDFVEAELTRDTFQNLGLQQGEQVYVRPRQVRVFVEDYQI